MPFDNRGRAPIYSVLARSFAASMQRRPRPERLDTDAGTPAEVAGSLRDLGRINRLFGGIGTTGAMIQRVAEATRVESLSLLEAAAGSGDIPRLVRRRVERQGISLEVSVLDRAWSHLKYGRRDHSPADGIRAVAADALMLPFRDRSFDVVSSTLFAHHLMPEQFAGFINEALRVSRKAVLINDLIRHPVHLALVYAGWPLYHSSITRHDAPASVRQAYTIEEVLEMLRRTAAARVEARRHYLFRMGVIVWKQGSS
jgi:ubiquinone/menaquinone biosynthesis C-methylase UbiE